ncbi:DUF4136 domain-containing protein [Sulfurimonas sp. MAG313]|nr:DUF4136 domain-containing protein [Sulfurimonas sp. MAG313]MDF1880294.1 DUF4136 domain-containing protein [Sulfurimonas sp. MAG313]
MKKILAVLVVFIVFMGCSSLKITTDFDPEFNFLEQKSFSIVHKFTQGEDTLLNDRLISALINELKNKAYVEVSKEEADLIFVFNTNAESKTDIDTSYSMVGYGGYHYGGHMIPTTRSYSYTKGTLIIDALNPKDKKIVWRGIATDILKSYDNPQERIEYIKMVVKEAMKEFPSLVPAQ